MNYFQQNLALCGNLDVQVMNPGGDVTATKARSLPGCQGDQTQPKDEKKEEKLSKEDDDKNILQTEMRVDQASSQKQQEPQRHTRNQQRLLKKRKQENTRRLKETLTPLVGPTQTTDRGRPKMTQNVHVGLQQTAAIGNGVHSKKTPVVLPPLKLVPSTRCPLSQARQTPRLYSQK